MEDAEEVLTVGRGYPDAAGTLSVDGCIMLSPRQCGSVAGVTATPHPVRLARYVMEHLPHVMLVGEGADRLATRLGLNEEPAIPEAAAKAFDAWRREHPHEAALRGGTGPLSPDHATLDGHDTVGVLVWDAERGIAGACSTSGLKFKWPGRVGDSPIIGHGLYVDPEVGAAVATGNGELIMRVCGTFLAVEMLRQKASCREAVETVLSRIAESCDPKPGEQAAFIVLAPSGDFAAGALRPGFQTAVRSENRNELVAPDVVYFPETAE
ncbi:MAG: glycosylasparaginase [Planctomycetota bacterium]|nr:MAG: glycosylasparaginase [Planctomycetota bacterium]